MLVLRRGRNESILIESDIWITIIECAADDARLITDASKQVSIIREGLSEAEQINKHAMSPNVTSVRSFHAAFKQYILKNGDKESS